MDRLAASFIRSAQEQHNRFQPLEDSRRWLQALQAEPGCRLERIPLDALEDWYFEAGSGDLRHRSGRFFSIRGLDCRLSGAPGGAWQQPIICQPEVGILGILSKDFDGVRYFLMQAKMEPGNVNAVQLSPTVQATYSNYTQAHKGRLPAYLDYFLGTRATVIRSQLQSETGTRFFRKFNNNILLDTRDEVEVLPGFRWLTLHELQALMALDDCVNMDTRSVLSGLPHGAAGDAQAVTPFWTSLCATAEGGGKRDRELRDWLREQRRRRAVESTLLPLSQVRDWVHENGEIRHLSQNYFRVTGLRVEAEGREVRHWTQPILRHEGLGLAGFLCAERDGILHFLIQAKAEPGIVGGVELGPTVSLFDYRARAEAGAAPPYLEHFLRAAEGSILHSSIQSEEGGRFWNLRNHFLVIRLPSPERVEQEDGYAWLTLGELQRLSQGECVVNSEARTLLSCLRYFN